MTDTFIYHSNTFVVLRYTITFGNFTFTIHSVTYHFWEAFLFITHSVPLCHLWYLSSIPSGGTSLRPFSHWYIPPTRRYLPLHFMHYTYVTCHCYDTFLFSFWWLRSIIWCNHSDLMIHWLFIRWWSWPRTFHSFIHSIPSSFIRLMIYIIHCELIHSLMLLLIHFIPLVTFHCLYSLFIRWWPHIIYSFIVMIHCYILHSHFVVH